MIVTPLGSGRFTVDVSKRERHTVDVRSLNWNGECDCATFKEYCLFMLLHQDQKHRERRQRCAHILAVREWIIENEYPFLVDLAEKIIELPTTNESRMADTDTGL